MTLYGDGRAALFDDRETAEKLGWRERRRSLPEPAIVLSPREGDPREEAWICPPRFDPAGGVRSLCRRSRRSGPWSYLPGPPGVLRYLARLAQPSPPQASVGLVGVGRVGGLVAAALATMPVARSGVREILIYDVDPANLERWQMELGAVTEWRGGKPLPLVRPTSLTEVFARCDVFLFAATSDVPPLGSKCDVRMAQLTPNRAILKSCLDKALLAGYTGLFLVVSDPVDWLSLAAFRDSNIDALGNFSGEGLAPERIGGLGLGVNWGRALASARQQGWEETVSDAGAAYGPHGSEVLVFDDLRQPSASRSEHISAAAREGNMAVRSLGFLPFVGPALSSVALTLPRLLGGREALASAFLGDVYFGCPARLEWGIYPAPQRMATEVFEQVEALHARMCRQAEGLDLGRPPLSPAGA